MDIPSEPATDAELVDRSKVGDHSAFGCLYDRHARMVRAVVAGSARGPSDVDDLSQEAFLRAFRNLSELKNADGFRTWLFGIAKNVARERRRSLSRDRHETAREIDLENCQAELPQSGRLSEETQLTLRELNSLPEDESLALRLFFLEERNAHQTAEALGLSRSGVYAILKRATKKLAAAVSQRMCERKNT
jgi:RNA polymerase sigma-70 factor (ECF subfamily)